MDIKIYARTYFENRIGTEEEERLLREYRIISINNAFINPEPPPFSKRFLQHSNLLVLFFDDVEKEMPGAFSNEQAMTIANFIQRDTFSPLLIHCTAGISRSGAVGLAIAEHFGCMEDFLRENSDIMPNQLVLRKLRTAFNTKKYGVPSLNSANKRLPHKGPRVICVNDRFIWHADTYNGWSDFLRTDEIVTILPYRGWTPELLIGNEKDFFEIWKNTKPEELLQPGELCIYGMGDGVFQPLSSEYYENQKCFSVCRMSEQPPFKIETLQDRLTLNAACSFLLGLNGHNNTFSPTVVCSKGRGKLKALMEDPQSTFIIASCWKPCQQVGDKCVPLDATENLFSPPPVLDLFGHINAFPQDKNLRDKNKRKLLFELQQKVSFSTLILRCGGRSIDSREPLEHNPCWSYSTWDYQSDSACFVLKPSYSKEGFEALKEAVMDRLAFLGVEALFVKEREDCYVLGCRSREVTLKYIGDSTIRFQRNRGERLPLSVVEELCRSLSEKVRFSLFSFLYKLYNHGAYGFAEVENLPEGMRTQINVPYIEEEIYRGHIETGGTWTGAKTFLLARRPVRRSQWEQIARLGK